MTPFSNCSCGEVGSGKGMAGGPKGGAWVTIFSGGEGTACLQAGVGSLVGGVRILTQLKLAKLTVVI